MGFIPLVILLAWTAAGVYKVVDSGKKPVGFLDIFLSGPAFWIIAGARGLFSWYKANKHHINI